jgi:hypothetical protein
MPVKPKELNPIITRSAFENFLRDFWHGKPPKLVGRRAVTGKMSPQLKRRVIGRIKEIVENATAVKIGVTGDTYVRMDCPKYREKFHFVQRVFRTTSEQLAIAFEVYLIDKFKKSCPEKVLNISNIPAGRLTSYNGFYYVYVVYSE